MAGLHSGHAYIRKSIRTAAVGKWGLGGPDAEGAPNNQRFDFFYGYLGQGQARSIRVPFAAYWPGTIEASQTGNQVSYLPDMMPTFCELAGVACSSRHDGISIVPELTGPPQPEHEALYWEFTNRQQRALRAGKRQFYDSEKLAPQLFELLTDEGEGNNLAPQEPAKLAELQAFAAKAHSDTHITLTLP